MHPRRACRQFVLAVCSLTLAWAPAVRLRAAGPAVVEQDAARAALAELADLLRQVENRGIADVSTGFRDLQWLGSAPARDVNPAMLKALGADADALRAAVTGDARDPQQAIASAIADLTLKAQYCRGRPEGMNAVVRLTVQTWTGNAIAPRWQVAYLSAPLAVLRRADGEQFPQFSSPTSIALPPGRYVIWAQDPADASRRGPTKEIALGEHGRDAVQVDVLVPKS